MSKGFRGILQWKGKRMGDQVLKGREMRKWD